jgi:tripartite-type tricarboxylate transporter receptor subunit TctC
MSLSRRHLLRMTAGACALAAAPRAAFAQSYPTRPVHLLVGFPAGTTADVFAREIGQWLADRLGRPFVIENRPGAGSSLAAEAVVGAPPDGHTLLWETAANTTATTFYDNLKFDLIRDIMPVGGVVRTFVVVVAHPALPIRTLPELIAYAKANPGKINAAVGGNGTLFHLAAELFKLTTGVDMVTVVYRGDGLALNDVLGGQVQIAFVGSSAASQQLKAGRLRALAVSSRAR